MAQRHVTISAHGGAHARPVAELVRLAAEHGHPVLLRTDDGTGVDLSSVLAVMDLALVPGDEVMLQTAGDGAEALLDALEAVLAPAPAAQWTPSAVIGRE